MVDSDSSTASMGSDLHVTNPDYSHVFKFGLDEVSTSFGYLTQGQQRRQMSPPFEAHGLHWIIALEKDESDENHGRYDFDAYLYCLSVPIKEEHREAFVIKGDIQLGERVFNGSDGRAFHLPGTNYPAEGLMFPKRVLFRIQSGAVDEVVETNTWSDPSDQGLRFGGFYFQRGLGVRLLTEHVCDPVLDGGNIKISIKFELPAPEPFFGLNFVNSRIIGEQDY